jgi:hypothetical protein
MADPNWAEIVTAVATAVGAIGLLSAVGTRQWRPSSYVVGTKPTWWRHGI